MNQAIPNTAELRTIIGGTLHDRWFLMDNEDAKPGDWRCECDRCDETRLRVYKKRNGIT